MEQSPKSLPKKLNVSANAEVTGIANSANDIVVPCTPRQIPIVCPGHSRPLAELSYGKTDNGYFIISACHDKLPMLRNAETGDWIGTFEGHKGAVWSAKFSHDGTRAATGSGDFTVKLWNARTGFEITTLLHKHVVKTVEFSLDDSYLFTGGLDKLIRVYNAKNLTEIVADSGVIEPVRQINCEAAVRKVVCIDNEHIASGEANGKLCLWKYKTGEKIQELSLCEQGIMDMEFNAEKNIITVAAGKKVHFYEWKENQLIQKKVYDMPISFLEEGGISLHPSGNTFIAGGSDTWVRVFNYETGKTIECLKGHHGPIRCLKFAPDGNTFATGSEDGTVRIWRVTSTLQ